MSKITYRITVKGQLGNDWAEWFDGWTITTGENSTTILSGQDADQAALHGVLIKIRNLNLPIISLQYIDPEGKDFSDNSPDE